jgi:membrane-associated phospholipid phosphatase
MKALVVQISRSMRRVVRYGLSVITSVVLVSGPVWASGDGSAERKLFWHLRDHFRDSYAGWTTLAHLGAIGTTWAMAVTDTDADIQQWAARQDEATSIGLALPGLAGGWFAPAIVPLWMRFRSDSVRTRNGGVAVAQAVGIALVVGNTVKALSGRREPKFNRPEESETRSRDFDVGFLRRGIYNGWPSGHSITNMAMASALAHYYADSSSVKRMAYGWAGYVMVSAAIGFQGDVHWASDVVAGGLMGWAIGRAVGRGFAASGNADSSSSLTIVPTASGLSAALSF